MTNTDRKAKYEQKLHKMGFTRLQIVTHVDDRDALLKAARMLREARFVKVKA